jgi:hypothetical protein
MKQIRENSGGTYTTNDRLQLQIHVMEEGIPNKLAICIQ